MFSNIFLLLTKTVGQPSNEGSSMDKAVNFNFQKVTRFKGQKIGTLSGIKAVVKFAHGDQFMDDQNPTVFYIQTENQELLNEIAIGVDLSQSESDVAEQQRGQLKKLLFLFSDLFAKNKRDLGTCTSGAKQSHSLESGDGASQKTNLNRRIPFAYLEEANNDLRNMPNDGIVKNHARSGQALVLV